MVSIRPSSMSVTVDMGSWNIVPGQAQRIARLERTACSPPARLTAITTTGTLFTAHGFNLAGYARPSPSAMKG